MSVEIRVTVKDEEVQRALKEMPGAVRRVFHEVIKEASDIARASIETATKTWKQKPEVEVWSGVGGPSRGFPGSFSGYEITVLIIPRGYPYGWVDRGTRGPYPIVAKHARFLAFHADYKAKTGAPTQLEARDGGPSGPMVFRKAVRHPGLKPRHITERAGEFVERELGPIFLNTVYEELDRVWR